MTGRARFGLLVGFGLTAIASALLAISGCSSGGGGGGGASAAANAWAKAVQDGNKQSLESVFAADYSFDGVTREPGGGADAGAPCPGFVGRDGEVTVEVVDLTENGNTAVAHIKVTYTGVLSALTGDDGPGGWGGGDGSGGTYVDPGIAPPAAPPVNGPEGESTTATAASHEGFALRSVQGEQVDVTPLIFTGFYELILEQIDGVWAVTAQRQVWTQLVVGSGAQAPVIETLLANGSESPTVDPRSEVAVTGTVRQTSETYIECRLGYMGAMLTLEGTSFSGSVRAPRAAGGYALEVYAINQSSDGGAYGVSTRSIPVTVREAPGVGFSFSVQSGVTLPAGVETLARGLSLAVYGAKPEDATQYIDPAYSYNGSDASGAIWSLPIACYGESDLAVTVTGCESRGGTEVVSLHFRQDVDNFWGYGLPDAVDGGAPSDPSSDRPSLPAHLRQAQAAAARARGVQAKGIADGVETMVNEGDFTLELTPGGDGYLVTAIRPVVTTTTNGTAPQIGLGPLTGNGSAAPSVAGGATLTVAGSVTGAADWLSLSNSDSGLSFEAVSGPFSGDLVSPFQRGRWLTTATAGAWSDSGSVYVTRTLEVTVTADAPTPTFTTAAGVQPDSGDVATLDKWLAALFLSDSGRLGQVYAPDYSYDGRTYEDVTSWPRLSAWHADFQRAEIVAAVAGAVTVELEFLGPDQWFGVPVYGGGDDGPRPAGDACTDPDGYYGYPQTSRTKVSMVFGLDDAHRIVSELISRGTCIPDGLTAPTLSDLRIDGAQPGSVAAGADVVVSATVTGDVGDVTARIGPSEAYGQSAALGVTAPATAGTYVAEMIARPPYPGGDEPTYSSTRCIAYPYGSSIVGAEVNVH
jgi:hypothetical protein